MTISSLKQSPYSHPDNLKLSFSLNNSQQKKEARSIKIFKVLLWLMCFYYCLGPLVNLIRLIRIESLYILAHYAKIFAPIGLLLSIFILLNVRTKNDRLANFGLFLVGMGTVIGVVQLGEARYFVSHFFSGLFIPIMFLASFNLAGQIDRSKLLILLYRFLNWSSYLITIAYLIGIVVFWFIAIRRGGIYIGFATNALLLPLSFFLIQRKRFWVLLCIVLMLVSGKRGVYLGLLLVCAIYFLPKSQKKSLSRALILSGIVSVALIMFSFIARDWIYGLPLPSWTIGVLNKWYMLDPFQEDILNNLDIASSHRSLEIQWSFKEFIGNSWNWLVGRGYGYSFRLVLLSGESHQQHYLHFSPLNFLYQYGILGVFFLILIFRRLEQAYKVIMQNLKSKPFELSIFMTFALYSLGSFVVGLTGFTYGQDMGIWISLGILSSELLRNREFRIASQYGFYFPKTH